MKATLTKVDKRISITQNRTDGILNYDIDNAYPQRVKDIVNSSGVASACIGMKARFLVGGGFTDKYFYKSKVNRAGLTADKLLRKVAVNMSYLPMVGIHINYNALYQKIEANYIPFENMRLVDESDKAHANMLAIYDDWQKIKKARIDKDKIDYLHFYNPDPQVIKQQVEEAGGWDKYKGQVFFYSPEGKEYPLAVYDSVLEDMQTDGKTKSFKFRNVTTNFMASHIISVPKTETQEGEEEGGGIADTLQDFQGADEAMKILLIERDPSESVDSMKIEKLEIQDVDKLYEFTETSVRDSIIFNFLQPPALFFQSKGFNSNEIQDATAYYNGITYYERLIIEEIFKEVFSNWATEINPTNDYSIIPFKAPVSEPKLTQEYFPYVTKNQILGSIGLPEVTEALADTKPLYESLGVSGLQALTALISDVSLTPEQKKNSLMIIFRLKEDEAFRLSGAKQI